MPVTLVCQNREVNPQFASFVDSADLVIICSFVVQLPGIDAATFDIIYPLQTLKPIASLLRSRVNSDVVEDDKTWRERLQNSVLNVPLPVSAILSEPKVKVSQMVNFKKGDLLQLGPVDGVDFLVDKKLLFKAEIGESNGQAAISLKNRIS